MLASPAFASLRVPLRGAKGDGRGVRLLGAVHLLA